MTLHRYRRVIIADILASVGHRLVASLFQSATLLVIFAIVAFVKIMVVVTAVIAIINSIAIAS